MGNLKSDIVTIGNVKLGGNCGVCVQSMTNTPTDDVELTVNQVVELADAGCELVRITTRSIKDVEFLAAIKNKLKSMGCNVPLIADVHFNPKVAELAAEIVEKVRINPGNYIDKKLGKTSFTDDDTAVALAAAKENILPLVEVCKKHNTSIRIGSNQGSLSDRIVFKYGDTALGMVEAVMEFVNIFQELDFHNIVISLKSSNPAVMIEANRLLMKRMSETGRVYPLHLGVTEAGSGQEARVKSAIGIGSLLCEGIGDTIRVSLSENPVNEIIPAKEIARLKNNVKIADFSSVERKCLHDANHQLSVICSKHILDSDPDWRNIADFVVDEVGSHFSLNAFENVNFPNATVVDVSATPLKTICSFLNDYFSDDNCKPLIIKKYYNKTSSREKLLVNVAVELGVLINNYPISGVWTNVESSMMVDILQATKQRLIKPEYISCPTCGRTAFDLIAVAEDVKKKTSHLKDITIGIMGCIVNGPGEMRGADYGVVGYGKDKVILYKGSSPIGKPFPSSEAADRLLELIECYEN